MEKQKENDKISCIWLLLVVIPQVLGVPRVMESLPIKVFRVVSPFPMLVDDLIGSLPIGAQLMPG